MNYHEFLTGSLQYIRVTAPDWDSVSGTLTLLERDDLKSEWKKVSSFEIVLGKNGLAWGKGLHKVPADEKLIKKEGDLRAPAGVFTLGFGFGYAAKRDFMWHYLPLNKNMKGIDDPSSRYYGCIVDESVLQDRDWKSAEIMYREDGLYKWGMTIDHNMYPAIPGLGSCIFMHIWRGAGIGTEGCTAMPEDKMKMILDWLNPYATPLLVQLPESI
jgi:D-alanyl-D-alanine dipeptidase